MLTLKRMCRPATSLRGSGDKRQSKPLDAPLPLSDWVVLGSALPRQKGTGDSLCQSTWHSGMPLSEDCSPIDLKVNSFQRLMLRRQQQPVGQKAGPPVQRPLGRNPCQFSNIIALGKMGKNHIGRLTVVLVLKKRGRGFVREVADARKNALLH